MATTTAINWNVEDDLPLADDADALAPDRAARRAASRRRVMMLTIAGAALWAAFAWIVVPRIIHSGYANTSFGPINSAFDHRHEHPVEFYLNKWSGLAGLALVAWIALGVFTLAFDSRAFARRFVPPATPGAIGVIRCLVALLGIYYTTIWDDLPSLAHMPAEIRKPMGSVELFYRIPGFAAMVASENALHVYRGVLVALFVLMAVGLGTRFVIPLASIMFLAFGGLVRSYQWYYHNGLIPWYITTAMIFMPASDGWSLDRLIRILRGKPVPPSDKATLRYGWARYVVWMCVALPYVEAGCSKLRNTGFDWWYAHNMRQMLSADSLKPNTTGDNLTLALDTAPDWIFAGLGLAGVGGEVAMIFALFSRWGRLIMPAMMFSMHLGIKLLQGILFLDLMILESVFYDWRKVRLWVGGKIARRIGTVDVLFDEQSACARKAIATLHGLDLFDRLRFIPSTNAGGTIALASDPSRRGFTAVKRVAWSLPGMWLVAPLLQLVPARSGTGSAERDSASPAPAYVAPPRNWRLLRPAAVSTLAVVLGCAWYLRLEWFPLTGMQMYSTPRTAHAKQFIDHIKVYAIDESGAKWPANLGEMAGVVRYWRVVEDGFKTPKQRAAAETFIRSAANRFNKTAPPGKRVTQIHVEQWRWDYVNHPDDADRGAPVSDIAVTIKPGPESPSIASSAAPVATEDDARE